MSRQKPKFTYGSSVYHKASVEKQPGIVIGVLDSGHSYEYVVDWGPSEGITENHEITLTDIYTPDFGDR